MLAWNGGNENWQGNGLKLGKITAFEEDYLMMIMIAVHGNAHIKYSIKFNANVIYTGIIIISIKMLLIDFMGIIKINI